MKIEINDLPPEFSPMASGRLFREKEDGRSFFLLKQDRIEKIFTWSPILCLACLMGQLPQQQALV